MFNEVHIWTMKKNSKFFFLVKNYQNLADVLGDHGLASLGDAYINFVYSLALSSKRGEPVGKKVKGSFLAEALKKSGLREILPSGMTRHKMADAVEALIVYAWLSCNITLKESVAILEKADNAVEGFTLLLTKISRRVRLS